MKKILQDTDEWFQTGKIFKKIRFFIRKTAGIGVNVEKAIIIAMTLCQYELSMRFKFYSARRMLLCGRQYTLLETKNRQML